MRRANSTGSLWNSLLLVVSAASMVAGLAACPGSLDDLGAFLEAGAPQLEGGAPQEAAAGQDAPVTMPPGDAAMAACPNPSDVPAQIFAPSCGTSGCHDAVSKAQNLDLVTAGVAMRLVNRPSTEVTMLMLASPMNPDQSYLMTKLTAAMPPVGARMPFLLPALSASQIQCVRAWITSQ